MGSENPIRIVDEKENDDLVDSVFNLTNFKQFSRKIYEISNIDIMWILQIFGVIAPFVQCCAYFKIHKFIDENVALGK